MVASTDRLLKAVLAKIKPDQADVMKEVDKFLKSLNAEIAAQGIGARATLGGSIAKDTNLAGDHDCDVFVRFNHMKYKDKDLSIMLEKILVKFDPILVHGSRDYFQIAGKMTYEIVPVLDISEPKQAMNVTDMSPLHVDWVNRFSRMKDDIRLTKQFCKANSVYGAESYINGLSGHVVDILTIHYGGFIKLLEASQKWRYRDVIDPENYFKGSALKRLNRSKIESALIVIDPVLPERNAAAAFSEDKFIKFVRAAKAFLDDPSEDMFIIKKITQEYLQQKFGAKLILLKAAPLDGKEDIVGAKLMKAFIYIKNQINFYDFQTVEADWCWDKKDDALFWFTVRYTDLLPLVKHIGPPVNAANNVAVFRKKHAKTFIENNRVCTYVPRAYTDVNRLIKFIVEDEVMFKDKVRSLAIVRSGYEEKKSEKAEKPTASKKKTATSRMTRTKARKKVKG